MFSVKSTVLFLNMLIAQTKNLKIYYLTEVSVYVIECPYDMLICLCTVCCCQTMEAKDMILCQNMRRLKWCS